MKKYLSIGLLSAVILSCSSAFAAEHTWAVAGKVGSLGIGADVHRVILPDRLNLRIGASFFRRGQSFTNSGISYDGTLRVGAIPAGLDLYPFKNWFRVQGGLMVNLNQIQGTARFNSSYLKIGAHSYTTDTIGQLGATVKVDRVAPFFGVGLFNPIKNSRRWGIFVDVGAMYHGEPTLTLQPTVLGSPFLRNDLPAQEQLFSSATHKYIFYPILQVGVSLR